MAQTAHIDFSEPIPLFAPPNCVLLPHASIPLHIFEPRYRAMTRDALASHNLIAMATFHGDDWKHDYQGNPPLRPHVCVGYIVRHERLADGRFNILLQGMCRAQIVREVSCDPYRTAILEATETEPVMEIDMGEHRQRIEKLLDDDVLQQLASVSAIHNWLSREIPTAALIDLAIMTLCHSVDERYDMLVEVDPVSRALWLERTLRGTRRTLMLASRIGPSQSPDGLCLN